MSHAVVNSIQAIEDGSATKPGLISIEVVRVPQGNLEFKEVSLSGKTAVMDFIIKDNGIGFDEKYLSNVFTLFKRLHTKDKYEGTGIGLAITKRIIEKHNGNILAKSTEGKGSDFIIVLNHLINLHNTIEL